MKAKNDGLTRQRRYQLRMKQAGRCGKCGKLIENGNWTLLCDKCRKHASDLFLAKYYAKKKARESCN